MGNQKQIVAFDENEFINTDFSNLQFEQATIENKTFENCNFKQSNFSQATFVSCRFIACEFISCNLSSIKLKNTSFNEVVFDESKLIGINWTQAKWPHIKLTSPIKFYRSNISHSSFYGLDLKELVIEECKAHDVDFREGDFSNGNFIATDLMGSFFGRTKLYAATFIDALNYQINPTENNIRKGKFSIPQAISLLDGFEIEIV